MTFCRCALTVRSEVPNSWAICVEAANHKQKTSLSRSVGLEGATARPQAGVLVAHLLVAVERTPDGDEQILLGSRFDQKILRAGLHGLHACRDVTMAGQKNDRQPVPSSRAAPGCGPLEPAILIEQNAAWFVA